jgi:hypothetical protein
MEDTSGYPCQSPDCKGIIPQSIEIEGKWYTVKRRKYCFTCSPLRSFFGRARPKKLFWTAKEYDFLISLYESNPAIINRELAQRCTAHFAMLDPDRSREITEGGIKGAIHRMREIRRIESTRPIPSTGAPRTWNFHSPDARIKHKRKRRLRKEMIRAIDAVLEAA